jgi:hypothetical protein
MIRYTGSRLNVQALVDAWIRRQREFNRARIFLGEVKDLPTGEVLAIATVADGRIAEPVGVELAKWLRAHGIAARP